MPAQRQAMWQRWSLAAFQLAHSRYAGLICHAARMLLRVGCIQKFTNLLRTFRISSLHPASGYLTPIGVDAGRLRGRQRDENETRETMPSASDTAYPSFKINPMAKELNELYTPTVRGVALQYGFAIGPTPPRNA
jgi:hypothetical protein